MKRNAIFLIIGTLIASSIIAGVLFKGRFQSKDSKTTDILEENIIPTVDTSVKVKLELVKKGEVSLTVENAPEGTRNVEYELTYDAQNPGGEEGVVPQGAIGKCSNFGRRYWECRATNQENIILGTCSSGTCVYHEIVGKVKVLLKFTGSYGQKIFEKVYELD